MDDGWLLLNGPGAAKVFTPHMHIRTSLSNSTKARCHYQKKLAPKRRCETSVNLSLRGEKIDA